MNEFRPQPKETTTPNGNVREMTPDQVVVAEADVKREWLKIVVEFLNVHAESVPEGEVRKELERNIALLKTDVASMVPSREQDSNAWNHVISNAWELLNRRPVRPLDAIEYIPPEENTHQRGSREWFLHTFKDLRDKRVDDPDNWMTKYPNSEPSQTAQDQYSAERRNKRIVAWFQSVCSFAQIAAESLISDERAAQQIRELSTSLLVSIDAKQATTDHQVDLGDTVLGLCIEALRNNERKGKQAA